MPRRPCSILLVVVNPSLICVCVRFGCDTNRLSISFGVDSGDRDGSGSGGGSVDVHLYPHFADTDAITSIDKSSSGSGGGGAAGSNDWFISFDLKTSTGGSGGGGSGGSDEAGKLSEHIGCWRPLFFPFSCFHSVEFGN